MCSLSKPAANFFSVCVNILASNPERLRNPAADAARGTMHENTRECQVRVSGGGGLVHVTEKKKTPHNPQPPGASLLAQTGGVSVMATSAGVNVSAATGEVGCVTSAACEAPVASRLLPGDDGDGKERRGARQQVGTPEACMHKGIKLDINDDFATDARRGDLSPCAPSPKLALCLTEVVVRGSSTPTRVCINLPSMSHLSFARDARVDEAGAPTECLNNPQDEDGGGGGAGESLLLFAPGAIFAVAASQPSRPPLAI